MHRDKVTRFAAALCQQQQQESHLDSLPSTASSDDYGVEAHRRQWGRRAQGRHQGPASWNREIWSAGGTEPWAPASDD